MLGDIIFSHYLNLIFYNSGFSLGHLHMGGTSAGGQSVNGGGLMKGDIDLMGET